MFVINRPHPHAYLPRPVEFGFWWFEIQPHESIVAGSICSYSEHVKNTLGFA
jgi:hypothetical protein